MINEYNAKKFCCEDISKIENYKQAIADNTQTWNLHHRRETDEDKTARQLIAEGLYYGRPADELIFLTQSAHRRLHMSGKHLCAQTREKLSKAVREAMTAEVREKISKATREAMNSPEVQEKISKPVQQLDKQGKLLATFPSQIEAERQTGIAQSNINKCCHGWLKSAGGFVWRLL